MSRWKLFHNENYMALSEWGNSKFSCSMAVNSMRDHIGDLVSVKCPICHIETIKLYFTENGVFDCHREPIDPNVISICDQCLEMLRYEPVSMDEQFMGKPQVDAYNKQRNRAMERLVKAMGEVD